MLHINNKDYSEEELKVIEFYKNEEIFKTIESTRSKKLLIVTKIGDDGRATSYFEIWFRGLLQDTSETIQEAYKLYNSLR